jgi:tetratricopeptide (TPR) repeat protein
MVKKNHLFVCLLLMMSFAAQAYDTTDSLLSILNNQQVPDTTRVNILTQVARNYRNINTKLAEKYGLEALKLSESTRYAAGVALASDVLGVINLNKADYQKALYYLITALKLNEENKNNKAYASTCNNIGSVYFHLKKYNMALLYYQKSLTAKLALGSKKEASSTYNNIGSIYMKTNNIVSCIRYYNLALENATIHKDTYNISIALMNLGEAYYDKTDYPKALRYYHKAQKINTIRNDKFHLANAFYAIGKINLKQGNLAQAEQSLLNGLQISDDGGMRSVLLNIHKELSTFYEKKEQYPLSLKYYKSYHELSDSIYNTETEKQISEIQSKYENVQKDKKIELLEVNNALQESNLSKANLFRNVLIIGFCLIIIILLVLIRNIILKQRVNKILLEKNAEIELQQLKIERQNNELKNYNQELMKDNISAKYEVLKSKINPHFLFNSLNTLSNLIIKDTPQAILFVTRFSKLYRQILDLANHQLITVDEELDFVNEYIYLQKIRFKDYLFFEITSENSIANTGHIPPFCLQMIIENVLKHNLVSRKHKLEISIVISRHKIVVSNNIQPKAAEKTSTGFGQKNIIDRYKLISELVPTFERTDTFYVSSLPIIYR